MRKATAIVRMASFPNRTPTGQNRGTAARKLAMYIGYGRGREKEQVKRPLRGLWHNQQGDILRHQDALGWVIEQAKSHAYTYQFILSAKHVDLDEDDYTKALQAGGDLFKTWRLMRHDDSAYPHAHIVAFGDKEIRIKEKEFKEWFQRVRGTLEQIQDQYLEMQKEMRMEITQPDAPSYHQGWGMEL